MSLHFNSHILHNFVNSKSNEHHLKKKFKDTIKVLFWTRKSKEVFMEKWRSFYGLYRVFPVCRHTPWFPLERFQIELDFGRSKFLLKNPLNSWIATINILNTNFTTRVYNYN
jgi:hypothetical protein